MPISHSRHRQRLATISQNSQTHPPSLPPYAIPPWLGTGEEGEILLGLNAIAGLSKIDLNHSKLGSEIITWVSYEF